jgi:hypothetical protein
MQNDTSELSEVGTHIKTIGRSSIILAVGGGLLIIGVGRFIAWHHFGWADALYCCAALVPAALSILLMEYSSHHAKLATPIPFLFSVLVVIGFPVFDVAFGLVIMGATAGSALKEWKGKKRVARG